MSAPTHARLAREVSRHHAACREADRAALGHALRAGELLIQAKAELQHGEWGAWVEERCGFAMRTAQLYMQLWRYAQANPQPVAHLRLSDAIRFVRQPHEGPPYQLRSPRLEYRIEFGRTADRQRFIALLCGFRSAGDPVPFLLRALEHYYATMHGGALLAADDEPTDAHGGAFDAEADWRARGLVGGRFDVRAMCAYWDKNRSVEPADA